MRHVEAEGPQFEEPTPEEERRQAIERNKQELVRRREAGELELYDYEPTYLWYRAKSDEPVTREDVGNHAIVITQRELKTLGCLKIVRANGEIKTIDPEDTGYEPDDPLIIFPEELGNIASK